MRHFAAAAAAEAAAAEASATEPSAAAGAHWQLRERRCVRGRGELTRAASAVSQPLPPPGLSLSSPSPLGLPPPQSSAGPQPPTPPPPSPNLPPPPLPLPDPPVLLLPPGPPDSVLLRSPPPLSPSPTQLGTPIVAYLPPPLPQLPLLALGSPPQSVAPPIPAAAAPQPPAVFTFRASFPGLVPFTQEAEASLRALLRVLLGGNGDVVITISDYEVTAAVATVPQALTVAQKAELEAALSKSLALSGEQSVALTSADPAAPARRLQRRSTLAAHAAGMHALRVNSFGIDAAAAMAAAGRMPAAVPAASAAAGVSISLSSLPVLSAVVTITVNASLQGGGTDFSALQAALASLTLPLTPSLSISAPPSPSTVAKDVDAADISAGTIAGAAAGVAVAVLLSTCMLVCCLRSRVAHDVLASAKPLPGAVSSVVGSDEPLSNFLQQRRHDALLRLADSDCVGEDRRAALLLVVQLEIFEEVTLRCQAHSASSICGVGASIAFALLLATCSSLCCARRREPRRIPSADLEDAPKKNLFAAVSNERRREALLRLADTGCVGASRRDALVSLLQAELSMRAVSRSSALFAAAKIAETLPSSKVEVLIPIVHDNGIGDCGVSGPDVIGAVEQPEAAAADAAKHTVLLEVVALDMMSSDALPAEAARIHARRRRRRPPGAISSASAPEAAGTLLTAPPHEGPHDMQIPSALASGAPACEGAMMQTD